MVGEASPRIHHCICDIFKFSSWLRNQNDFIKQALYMQLLCIHLPINTDAFLIQKAHQSNRILAFSLLSSYLRFSKVLWQEDSDSSNQSSSFGSKYSNTLREAFRGDPNLYNTSVRGESSSSPLTWSCCSWGRARSSGQFQSKPGISTPSKGVIEVIWIVTTAL